MNILNIFQLFYLFCVEEGAMVCGLFYVMDLEVLSWDHKEWNLADLGLGMDATVTAGLC